MGAYRVLLSIAVLASHLGQTLFGMNIGVVAVISFFLLSGYIMRDLIARHYSTPGRAADFYLDRSLRILPQYLLYLCLAVVLYALVPLSSPFVQHCTANKIAQNFAVIPLDFAFLPGLSEVGDCMLVPQAWSLGLEACFYLAAPWLFFASASVKRGVAVVSLAVFGLAFLSVINPDAFGYRLLPGTLFMFMAGASLHPSTKLGSGFARLVWTLATAGFAATCAWPSLVQPYNREVLAGLIVGIPAVTLLARHKFTGLDEWLGNLSYGIFLNHMLITWIARDVFGYAPAGMPGIIVVTALSSAAAVVSYYVVERPALEFRRSIRTSENLARAAVPTSFP